MEWIASGIVLLIIIIVEVIYYNNKKKQLEKEVEEKLLQEKRKIIKEKIEAEEEEQRAQLKRAFDREIELYRAMANEKKGAVDAEVAMQIAAVREKQSSAIQQFDAEILRQNSVIEQKKQELDGVVEQLELRKAELQRSYDATLAAQQEKIAIEVASIRALKTQQMNNALMNEEAAAKAELANRMQAFMEECSVKQMQYAADLKIIEEQLEEYRKKRQVINEEILRQRALEEKQDFYRIVLPTAAIDDIQLLLSIRENLKQRENLDKLIYEAYISKPTQEMIKRVLEGRAPSGIYKITRLKTGEIYIGKSTDIKKRWGEHSKTAYGVGTIAHSTLHTTIKKDGIQNFTFELLEEVPKDKLTEREKYWITFYDSKSYGLNERNG